MLFGCRGRIEFYWGFLSLLLCNDAYERVSCNVNGRCRWDIIFRDFLFVKLASCRSSSLGMCLVEVCKNLHFFSFEA